MAVAGRGGSLTEEEEEDSLEELLPGISPWLVEEPVSSAAEDDGRLEVVVPPQLPSKKAAPIKGSARVFRFMDNPPLPGKIHEFSKLASISLLRKRIVRRNSQIAKQCQCPKL